MARAIDGDELLGIERLLDTDVIRKSKTASWLLDQVLHDIQAVPTLALPNEALTLEELRQMDGKPVWCKYIGDTTFPDQWMVVNAKMEKCGNAEWGLPFEDNPDDAYGETWLAYAAEPHRLDRSAWEPCVECAQNCSWCKHYQEIAKAIPDICHECKHYSNYEPDYNFCCECGRPLTDAAWEMLEKRLEKL